MGGEEMRLMEQLLQKLSQRDLAGEKGKGRLSVVETTDSLDCCGLCPTSTLQQYILRAKDRAITLMNPCLHRLCLCSE